jgi:hypothetical protein
VQYWKARSGPPDDVAAVGAHIDARRKEVGVIALGQAGLRLRRPTEFLRSAVRRRWCS